MFYGNEEASCAVISIPHWREVKLATYKSSKKAPRMLKEDSIMLTLRLQEDNKKALSLWQLVVLHFNKKMIFESKKKIRR